MSTQPQSAPPEHLLDEQIRRIELPPQLLQEACEDRESEAKYLVRFKSGMVIVFQMASIGGHGVEVPYSFCGNDWIHLDCIESVTGAPDLDDYDTDIKACGMDVRLSEISLVTRAG